MIGLIIGNLLKDNQLIVEKVDQKIYSRFIPEGVSADKSIVYKIINRDPNYTKSGLEFDIVNLVITCYTTSYVDNMVLMNLIRSTTELYKGHYQDVNGLVMSTNIDSIEEDYDFEEAVYISTINYTIYYNPMG